MSKEASRLGIGSSFPDSELRFRAGCIVPSIVWHDGKKSETLNTSAPKPPLRWCVHFSKVIAVANDIDQKGIDQTSVIDAPAGF